MPSLLQLIKAELGEPRVLKPIFQLSIIASGYLNVPCDSAMNSRRMLEKV